jgi:hypothetical protein
MTIMKPYLISLVMILCCFGDVMADCTPRDVEQMRSRGFNDFEIMRICGSPNRNHALPSFGLPPPTNICQTPNMWCVINQYGPVGASCWCVTPYGPVSGVLVPQR